MDSLGLKQLKAANQLRHNDKEIVGFFEPYRWLSNYHLCDVKFHDIIFPSSENAFQACKYPFKKITPFITCTPKESKELGKLAKIDRILWDKIKYQLMYEIVYNKFTYNPELRELLLDTGDRHLEESNWWNDKIWGTCNGEGTNWLGKILMDVRARCKYQDILNQ